jgi:hypothetical protein
MPKASRKEPKPEELTTEQRHQKLVERAKRDKRIDQRDIFALIPETPENAEALDELYTELADLNIEITETSPDGTTLADGWAAEEEPEEEDTTKAVYLDDDVADDSVRLYFR